MVLLSLLFFIGSATALKLTNLSSTASTLPVSSSSPLFNKKELKNKVLQVSPKDIENNTAPYLRYGYSLDSLLGPEKPQSSGLSASLFAQLSNTEPNLLNLNNLNLDNGQSYSAFDLQTLSSLLNTPAVPVNSSPNLGFIDVLQSLLGPSQQPTHYSLSSLYQSLLPKTNNDPLLNSLQSLLGQQYNNAAFTNVGYPYGSVLSDNSNNLDLNTLQSLLNPLLNNGNTVQYTTAVVGDKDDLLKTIQSLLNPKANTLQLNDNNKEALVNSVQQLLSQDLPVEPKLSNKFQAPDESLLKDINNVPSQDTLQKLLDRQVEESNPLTDNSQPVANPIEMLRSVFNPSPTVQPSTNTQLVFKSSVPNLHMQACKLAFETLLHKAYKDYLKLVNFPACQHYGENYYQTSPLPFEVIVVQPKIVKPSVNPVLLKFLWLLLNKLQKQNVPNNSNLNVLLELLLKPERPVVKPKPNNILKLLYKLLKLLKKQKHPKKPSKEYLVKVILGILNNKKVPNENLSQVLPLPFNPPLEIEPEPSLPLDQPKIPLALPDFTLPPSNDESGKVKYVVLVFKKYFPQHQFTTPDLLFLIKLVKSLPKTINELLLNPQLLKFVIDQLAVRNLNPKLVLAVIYSHLINLPLLPSSNSRVVELVYQVKKQDPIVYQPYYYVTYKVPYTTFVKNLYKLLIVNPYLKNNRDLLFRELLLLALANTNALSADLNGVSRDQLVNLVVNNGAVLKVNVLTGSNILQEQLKVVNAFNSQLNGVNTGFSPGSSAANLWSYLLNKNTGTSSNTVLELLGNSVNNALTPGSSNSVLELLEKPLNNAVTPENTNSVLQLLENSANKNGVSDNGNSVLELLDNSANNVAKPDNDNILQLLQNSVNNANDNPVLQLLENSAKNAATPDSDNSVLQLLENSDNNLETSDNSDSVLQLLENSANNLGTEGNLSVNHDLLEGASEDVTVPTYL